MPRQPIALFWLLATTMCALGQPAVRDHTITVADYFSVVAPTDAVPSPDGSQVAYSLATWEKETNDRKSDLWVVPAGGGEPRRLTSDRANDRSISWHPDGKSVLAIGNRRQEGIDEPPYDGSSQLWQVSVEKGDVRPLTKVDGGVQAFALASDGKTVWYLMSARAREKDWEQMRKKFPSVDYAGGTRQVSELWKLDLGTGKGEKVFAPGRFVHEFALSPDDRHVAMITAPDDTVLKFEGQSRVEVLDLAAKESRVLNDALWRAQAPSPWGWLESLAWSTDGKALAFNIIFDAYPCEIIVADWRAGEEPKLSRVRRPEGVSIRGYGTPLHWVGPTTLCFLGDEKARCRLYAIEGVQAGSQGLVSVRTPGDVVVQGFRSGKGGQLAAILNTPKILPEVFHVPKEGAPRRLTRLNPHTETWKFPRIEIVQWKAEDGTPVEGVLELPADHQPGKRLPLVVEIHGGPSTSTHFQIDFGIYGRTLLPARGVAVLSPNYRGSTGYGDRFETDLVGKDNDIDVRDILSGVDAMVERGIADPDRLGVMGWSNGGYLTNCLISKTTRFKAASSGASIVDTVLEWGVSDEPAYMTVFKEGTPWEKPAAYRRSSSTYDLGKIRTPTLIHVGGRDERCPPGHSQMLYRALRHYNKVPTELLVYPGEPHGLLRYSSREAKITWDLAWFDRYLLGKQE